MPMTSAIRQRVSYRHQHNHHCNNTNDCLRCLTYRSEKILHILVKPLNILLDVAIALVYVIVYNSGITILKVSNDAIVIATKSTKPVCSHSFGSTGRDIQAILVAHI